MKTVSSALVLAVSCFAGIAVLRYPSEVAIHDHPVHEPLEKRVVPTGSIIPFAGTEIPPGWLECNGQKLDASLYLGLAEVLKGTIYFESGQIAVPDLRGRVVIGVAADRPDRALGMVGGSETHTLTEAEIPAHSHGVNDPGHAHAQVVTHDEGERGDEYPAVRRDLSSDVQNAESRGAKPYDQGIKTKPSTTKITIHPSGGGGAHNIMQPYVVLRYLIKT